jgi:hypothetical protein
MGELIPYLNTGLLLFVVGYVLRIEHRLTKLEDLTRRVRRLEVSIFPTKHHRDTDFSIEEGE